MHVRLDGVNRRLDDQLDADGGREVHDGIAGVDHLGEQRLVADRVDGVVEARVRLELRDVVDRARRQVVEHEHFVTALQQRVGQMGTDETCAAGDENTQD